MPEALLLPAALLLLGAGVFYLIVLARVRPAARRARVAAVAWAVVTVVGAVALVVVELAQSGVRQLLDPILLLASCVAVGLPLLASVVAFRARRAVDFWPVPLLAGFGAAIGLVGAAVV